MKKILFIVLVMFASLVHANDVELWHVERVIIGDWQKAFNAQYGKTLTLYLMSENPGLRGASFDTKDGLINAHGSINYSKVSNLLTRITEICVAGRCIDHAVNIDYVVEQSYFKLTLSDVKAWHESKVTILSMEPLILHFDNLPGMRTWGIIEYRRKQ
jgi:hypothetical protein